MMDVPNQTPLWPSATGPKVPDFNAESWKNRNLDMDTALAWLRKELVSLFEFLGYGCFAHREGGKIFIEVHFTELITIILKGAV